MLRLKCFAHFTMQNFFLPHMPDLSDLVPIHSRQVRIFNRLVLGQVLYKESYYNSLYFIIFLFYYNELACCMENSMDPNHLASLEAS